MPTDEATIRSGVAMLDRVAWVRQRMGIEGLHGQAEADRINALFALDGQVYSDLLLLADDGVREARIAAIVRGYTNQFGHHPISGEGGGGPRPRFDVLSSEDDEREDPRPRCRKCGKVLRGAGPLCTECWRKENVKKRR